MAIPPLSGTGGLETSKRASTRRSHQAEVLADARARNDHTYVVALSLSVGSSQRWQLPMRGCAPATGDFSFAPVLDDVLGRLASARTGPFVGRCLNGAQFFRRQ